MLETEWAAHQEKYDHHDHHAPGTQDETVK